MKKKFIFDVDGTLTPSRGKMDTAFSSWFEHFATHNAVYFVTGSDKIKTVEQVGNNIYNLAIRVYNCSGNDVWERNINIRTNSWALPDSAADWLTDQLNISGFSLRTGLHLEHRPGMVNFSIVGRNADQRERAYYVKWDKETNERNQIAYKFNLMFPELEAKVGGETGLDISPKGYDKSQILKDFDNDDYIMFFGDAMYEGGNDWPLAVALENRNTNYKCYNVSDWNDTFSKLKELQ